jgi:hypothetical protein
LFSQPAPKSWLVRRVKARVFRSRRP